MPYERFRRVPTPRRAAKADKTGHKAFAAPVGGWASAVNLANVDPAAGLAYMMENIFPTSTGARVRSGSAKWATPDAVATNPVESLITYIGGVSRKVFSGCNGKITNITSPATPTTVPAADVSGQTKNYYSSANFATAGGSFLYAVNGGDFAQLYNGATWQQVTAVSAPIAITGVATNLLSHVWVSQSRLWFVEKGSQRAWFLPANALGGAAQALSLAGVFQKGGSLVLGATWSVNTSGGLVIMTVFISSEGEYAIYQGADPTTAAGFVLVGVYEGSPPLGLNQNATMKAGGDLLILTQAGLTPLSDIQNKDPAALAFSAVSRKIAPDWLFEQVNRRGLPWEIIKWPSRNYALVNCPVANQNTPPICFVVNLETGAWCKYTNWDTRCLAVHNDTLLFGTNTATVILGETTGADQGMPYLARFVGHMDHLDNIGETKTTKQARAIFRATLPFTPKISVTTDYVVTIPTPPNAAAVPLSSGSWDVGQWDVMTWDSALATYTASTQWVDVPATGFAHAPVLQITSGSQQAPSVELVVFEMTYEAGGIVVG